MIYDISDHGPQESYRALYGIARLLTYQHCYKQDN